MQTLIPASTCNIQNYTATSGDRAVLHCPITPGALLQNYSVIWKKDNVEIAEVSNPHQNVNTADCKYDIDRATYALIIDPVSANDSSTGYNCHVYVSRNSNKQELHCDPQTTNVSLSLTVLPSCECKFILLFSLFNITNSLIIYRQLYM